MKSISGALFFILLFAACRETEPVKINQEDHLTIDNHLKGDAKTDSLIQPFRNELEEKMGETIGESEMEMTTDKPQGTLGNFVADLCLLRFAFEDHTYGKDSIPAMVLLNTRGLRAALPSGQIKRSDIFAIMPFENELVWAKLNKVAIEEMLNHTREAGGHIVSENVKMEISKNGPVQFKVNEVQHPSFIWVLTTDYLIGGGENMEFLGKALEYQNTNVKVRDAIIEHFIEMSSKNEKARSSIDKRLVFIF